AARDRRHLHGLCPVPSARNLGHIDGAGGGAMSQVQDTVVERAERLTRERIAPRAGEYDAAGANPIESWRDLWREGLLAGAIPKTPSGLGLDLATYIEVVVVIARGCASAALTVH